MNSEPQTLNQFVSRGGIKLQHAISNFRLQTSNLIVLDVGSSTGGFVDCLLQNGAAKVYALDTAYGELAWKLRNDPRVVVMERTNILHLKSLPGSVIPAKAFGSEAQARRAGIQLTDKSSWIPDHVWDDKGLVDLITIDAGWTKLELILPVVRNFLKPNGKIIALLKPHYEADKKDLVKGVLKADKLQEVKDSVFQKIVNCKLRIENSTQSPILGGGGNIEYLLLLGII